MLKAKLKIILPLFLVANTISWFMLTMVTVLSLSVSDQSHIQIERILSVSGSYFTALLFSALIGATLLANKMKQRVFVSLWTIIGASSCLSFYFLGPQAPLFTLGILSLILGASVGLGIPMCLSIFANQTKNEKMGRIGAVLFFIIQIMTAAILFPLDGLDLENKFLFFSLWRILGLVGIVFLIDNKSNVQEKITPLFKILKDRTFILYFLPWFMFALINFIQIPIVEYHMGQDIYDNYVLVTFVLTSFSAIGAGFLCDFKGRKVTGIVGFVLLGVAYAFLSFLSDPAVKLIGITLFTIFDGLAWGFLYVNFIFVVWGDLSDVSNRAKYYFLGGMPFLLSGLIQVLIEPFANKIPIQTSFSLASFFLFIATLPLLYAPESLSDKLMKSRELFNYVNKALKKVQKEKETTPEQHKEQDKDEIEAEETPEDVEARKLAEKYY
jgi:MFS family permease